VPPEALAEMYRAHLEALAAVRKKATEEKPKRPPPDADKGPVAAEVEARSPGDLPLGLDLYRLEVEGWQLADQRHGKPAGLPAGAATDQRVAAWRTQVEKRLRGLWERASDSWDALTAEVNAFIAVDLALCDSPAEKAAAQRRALGIVRQAEQVIEKSYAAGRLSVTDILRARGDRIEREVRVLLAERPGASTQDTPEVRK